MPELVIKYKNKRTLEVLMEFAKYFDFSVVVPSKDHDTKVTNINGVTIIPADSSVDTSGLETIFSSKSIDAKKLRTNAWQRNR
jgi:hypothetical protein